MSNDQMDAVIYFLMYTTLLGVIATVGAGTVRLCEAITQRKLLKTKRLESKH